MQWEYGCLIRRAVDAGVVGAPLGEKSGTTYMFYGLSRQKALEGTNAIEILDRLGQDGWEMVTVETAYFQGLTERIYWLKRPLHNR